MSGLFANPSTPATTSTRYARVAVERGIDAGEIGEGLLYRLEGDLESVRVGERVEVPLGRKRSAGIVVEVGGAELLGALDDARVRPVESRTGAALTPALVGLARWMARYYVCPLGMVLATMMPAAVKKQVGRRVRRELTRAPPEPERPELTPALAHAWSLIERLPGSALPAEKRTLAAMLELKSTSPLTRLVALGYLEEVERVVHAALPPVFDRGADPAFTDEPPEPNEEQRQAIEGIAASLGSFGVHLIHGVTGSGKTEVYLRVIERVLARGERAIVLVPEISLTPQTAGRFYKRFERAGVAVLHSGLAAGQRNQQWALAASGRTGVIVGARSAVFAPAPGVGLIVVDEEHASDYKQDQLPRYHARDVAIKRAQSEGFPVVLGSATPSLESYYNASRGRYTLWHLRRRVGGGSLPRVEIVDLRLEHAARLARTGLGRNDRSIHLLGPRLEDELRRTLEAGGQAILLLNRRGFANYVCCPSVACGWTLECDQCDARLVFHKGRTLPRGGFVRCHHCLAERMLPSTCPRCGLRPNLFGIGTQRLEEELTRKFFDLRMGAIDGREATGLIEGETMLRVDGDTMAAGGAAAYFDALTRFARGDLRLLLGTQIISKGLDFPNVRLVGVVSADTALSMPDFRSAERTFQLVSQVAGRAGRGREPGIVIVQTFEPASHAIRLAARHDYQHFADLETAIRKASRLPPITRMARIVVRDKAHSAARATAQQLVDLLRAEGERLRTPEFRVDGPMDAPVSRVHGHYRVAVEVTAATAAGLLGPLESLRRRGLLKSDARTAVDVDPVSLA